MHRLSEAMHIALLATRRLVLSVAAKSRREVARQNQTSAYCSVGRIQWRVNNARARTAKSAPDASTMRNTGLAYATSRVPSLSLSFSIFLPRSYRYLFSKTRRHYPRFILNPFVRPLRPKGCETARGACCASPIEMHRFHYKLLMRQICLSASQCLYWSPLSCAVIVSTADNNIWATPSRTEW